MCGIYGFMYFDQSASVNPVLLDQMGAVLNHRGPDANGTWSERNIGLGHRRLSIIDLSEHGNQPMTNEDGSVIVSFNGEIYNFQELRKDLVSRNHIFKSNTDTEVLVHLWEEKGVNCLEQLRGMFAFTIWDRKKQVLFLARDREGQKPLFYRLTGDRIVFASEIKSILCDPDYSPEPDIEAIHHYLNYQSVPSPFCAFKGIRKLPHAHYMLVKANGSASIQRYWNLSYNNKLRVETESDRADLEKEIIERLKEAIRIRMISDVPLGAFLSGGLDSSLVAALMAEMTDHPVKTFSIGFTYEQYDETQYARMVADRYETEHHEFIVTPESQAIIPDLIWHYNEPFADSSAIPTYYVSKLAREHVTVVINGDAGDENFAGYNRYKNEGDYALKKDFPSFLGRWWRRLQDWPLFLGSGFPGDFKRISRLTQERWLYYLRITHFHEIYKKFLYTDGMKDSLNRNKSVDLMLDLYQRAHTSDFLDSTLYVDLNMYLPDTLMVKVDIASMAHSLEARSPMLDHKFLEYIARIPSGLKLFKGSESKYIMKKAAEPYLPHEVIYRKKMGFGVPLDEWFRNELKEMAYDVLLSKKAIERGFFNRDYIESLLDRHQKGETWQTLIWNLLMLELWFNMFIDGTMPKPSGITVT